MAKLGGKHQARPVKTAGSNRRSLLSPRILRAVVRPVLWLISEALLADLGPGSEETWSQKPQFDVIKRVLTVDCIRRSEGRCLPCACGRLF